MKRAEKINWNIHTYRIDEEWQKFDEEITKAEDYFCKATVDILEREEEGYSLVLYDEKDNTYL